MVEIGNMSLKLKIGLAALKYKSKKILKYIIIYNRANRSERAGIREGDLLEMRKPGTITQGSEFISFVFNLIRRPLLWFSGQSL